MKRKYVLWSSLWSERADLDTSAHVWLKKGSRDWTALARKLRGPIVRSVPALAAGALLLGFSASVADAQPAPFFSPLESPSGTGGSSVARRVSPSGDWVLGPLAGDMGTFLWHRPTGLRFDVANPPGVFTMTPAVIDERLSIVVANGSTVNGSTQSYFLGDNGGAWFPLGDILSPQFTDVRMVGTSADGQVTGFKGTDASGNSAAIAVENGTVLDLGAAVAAQLGLNGSDNQLRDVATGRATSIGINIAAAGNVAWLYDHPTGIAVRIDAPNGETVSPRAVSQNGAVVTGSIKDSAGGLHAFRWQRKYSPIDGPYNGAMSVLSGLNPQVSVVTTGEAIDAAGNNIAGLSYDGVTVHAVVWQFPYSSIPVRLDTLTSDMAGSDEFIRLSAVTDMSPWGVMAGYGENQAGTLTAFAARRQGAGCNLEFDQSPAITFNDVFFFLALLGTLQSDYNLDGVADFSDVIDYFNAWNNRALTPSGCN